MTTSFKNTSWTAIVIMLATTGCAAPRDGAPPIAHEKAVAIELGQPESGHPAVGRLEPDDHSDLCTGTLIAPDVVLTAEHCLHGGPWRFYPDGYPQGIGIRGSLPYPGLRDQRLVYLEQALPIETLPIHQGPLPGLNTECVAVGYGAHHAADGGVSFGNKRSAIVRITKIELVMLYVARVTGIGNDGDSGGPLLCRDANGDHAIVATVRGHLANEWPYDEAYYHSVNPAWIADPSIDLGVEGYDCSEHEVEGDFCAIDEAGRSAVQTCDAVRGMHFVTCDANTQCFPWEDGGVGCQTLQCDRPPYLECDPGFACIPITWESGTPTCQPAL